MNAPLKKPAQAGADAPADWQALDAKSQAAGAPEADGLDLPEPPMDDEDEGQGVDVDDLPTDPAPGVKPGRNLAPSAQGGGGGQQTAASTNFPPVGDIKLNKSKGTFNTYKLELSYGQIEAIRQALQKDHANPIADELLQMFDYYISTVPGPGEEEEDVKARDESARIGKNLGAEEGDDEMGVPMPPNAEQEAGTTVAGEGPEGGGNPDDLDADPRFNDLPDGGGGGEGGAPDETDERLPAPPRE